MSITPGNYTAACRTRCDLNWRKLRVNTTENTKLTFQEKFKILFTMIFFSTLKVKPCSDENRWQAQYKLDKKCKQCQEFGLREMEKYATAFLLTDDLHCNWKKSVLFSSFWQSDCVKALELWNRCKHSISPEIHFEFPAL